MKPDSHGLLRKRAYFSAKLTDPISGYLTENLSRKLLFSLFKPHRKTATPYIAKLLWFNKH